MRQIRGSAGDRETAWVGGEVDQFLAILGYDDGLEDVETRASRRICVFRTPLALSDEAEILVQIARASHQFATRPRQ